MYERGMVAVWAADSTQHHTNELHHMCICMCVAFISAYHFQTNYKLFSTTPIRQMAISRAQYINTGGANQWVCTLRMYEMYYVCLLTARKCPNTLVWFSHMQLNTVDQLDIWKSAVSVGPAWQTYAVDAITTIQSLRVRACACYMHVWRLLQPIRIGLAVSAFEQDEDRGTHCCFRGLLLRQTHLWCVWTYAFRSKLWRVGGKYSIGRTKKKRTFNGVIWSFNFSHFRPHEARNWHFLFHIFIQLVDEAHASSVKQKSWTSIQRCNTSQKPFNIEIAIIHIFCIYYHIRNKLFSR